MTLSEWAARIAGAAPPIERIEYGPWLGSMRSKSAEQVPPTHLASGNDFLYQPRTGTWKRRGGMTVKFDTLDADGTVTGLLPAKWGTGASGLACGRCRQMEEFISDSVTDGIPTIAALVTKEEMDSASVDDDGRFGTMYVRDQVNSLNYMLGSDFSSSTYPAPGTAQTFKVPPLWYESGEGGISRGPEEFQRRFFLSGSRSFKEIGRWIYSPGLLSTPLRWSRTFAQASVSDQSLRASGLTSPGGWEGNDSGLQLHTYIDEATADDSDYIQETIGAASFQIDLGNGTDPGHDTGFIIRFRYNNPHASNSPTLGLTLKCGATTVKTITIASIPTTSGWLASETTLSSGEAALITDFTDLGILATTAAASTVRISWFELFIPGVTAGTNRIMPSGPLPPVHAGTLAVGDMVETSEVFMYPDGDVSDGGWLNSETVPSGTNLYSYIDDTTDDDDTTYIQSNTGGTLAEQTFSTPSFVPQSDAAVVLRYRARITAASPLTVNTGETLHVDIYAASTLCVSTSVPPTTSYQNFTYQLTPAEISAITALSSDWSSVNFKVYQSGGTRPGRVTRIKIGITANSATLPVGGWKGSDKFYYSVAYRFEDDSIWMPCTPRGPNTLLGSGYNLFQVDGSNPSAGYQKLTWSNIPIGPYGTKSRLLLRTPKIDSSTQSTLSLVATDLRLVEEIADNTTTTFDDFKANDLDLALDAEKLFIRFDHSMPYRARYIGGGDTRIFHAYGGLNPCAILLAPVGYTAAYDRNVADTSSTLYGSEAFYYRVTTTALELYSDSGSALGTVDSYAFSTYTTLESLVDAINATTVSSNAKMWRAQIAPGANRRAPSASCLTPTTRDITSCVVSGQSITKSAGGLNDVPVGAWIQGTGVTDGAYVSAIVSDTELTFVGTITAATKTLTYNSPTGDNPSGSDTVYSGYVRALGNCLPSFLFFNKSYLDGIGIYKDTVWTTVASPGSVKSAPNCFSIKLETRHSPPEDIGISMGGFAVDNGFVVPFSKGLAAIRNTRDSGTGVDQDYKLFIVDKSKGCVSWSGIAQGNRCGVFPSAEGFVACDLFNARLFSQDIYLAPDGEQLTTSTTGTGDFAYEMPACVAATAQDNDSAYLHARIMRGRLWINYRATSAAVHPNRQVVYSFSDGEIEGGIQSLFRENGSSFGWSLPVVKATSAAACPTAMCEGRRSDGGHLYGWHESPTNNTANSTGDGRIDEFETGTTDNGTAISAIAGLPWLQHELFKVSAQAFTLWHSTPSGATVSSVFHRSFSDQTQTLTPTTSSSLVVSKDRKELALGSRPPSDAFYLDFRQTAGTASELKKVAIEYIVTNIRKPAA